jgi:hypothetical protein
LGGCGIGRIREGSEENAPAAGGGSGGDVSAARAERRWRRQARHRWLLVEWRSIKDGRSRRILPEWVEAYVQDRAKADEDM